MLLLSHLRERGYAWQALVLRAFDARPHALIQLVAEKLPSLEPAPIRRPHPLARLGAHVVELRVALIRQLDFLGRTVSALAAVLRQPSRLRQREFFVQLEVVGVGAIAIVALMTFLIGVVFAYLLAIQIEKYGANIFIVDGVALAVARELSPILAAILVAGRSGAAFTAQIGAMKVSQEIDAIASLGLSPIQVLVIPRLLAIIVALPLLTFFGDIMGVLGAAVVAAAQLDITTYTFFTRLQNVLPSASVFYGLAKAPVFAVAIALIACRNGFAVSHDAKSVGERTTATVVQSLVAVILINAAFAVAFPEIGL